MAIAQCFFCGYEQDVTYQVEQIIKHNKNTQETHCKKCNMVITVVLTMMGTRCLETLIDKETNNVKKKYHHALNL